ncbi:MAG: FAD:protein FMN transferase [Oscillospiraceae bacterium]|nr:FAD:protein FMN transferase [Oscillospiraceae bacterium]
MKKRVLFLAAAAALAAALAAAYLAPRPRTVHGFAMGSVLTQTYWEPGKGQPVLWYDGLPNALRELEKELAGATEAPPLAIEIMEASNGAFDPYLGALSKLWDVDGQGYVPAREEIDRALQAREVGLGAYGKGAACDEALRVLLSREVPYAAVINLGGNILTYGRKPWNRPFKIALRDPNGGPSDTIGVFTLRGARFISTSGSYEKYFERDGITYHHIFDPRTGCPARRDPGLVSVTVISAGGALGDALSTACFVLGYEASLDLLATYGCDALFVYEGGEIRPVGRVMEYWSEA